MKSNPRVLHRSVTMSSMPPKELHWLNLRAAIPSNKSAAKEYTYDASANYEWIGGVVQ